MEIKKFLLIGLGFIFLALGAIGLFLPVWPTTPFVLVSVTCFSSTPKIKAWIMKNHFFREHIENYEYRTGLSNRTLWISLIWLWSMLVLSIILIQIFWIYFCLLLIGVAVTCHIIMMAKAKNRKKKDNIE